MGHHRRIVNYCETLCAKSFFHPFTRSLCLSFNTASKDCDKFDKKMEEVKMDMKKLDHKMKQFDKDSEDARKMVESWVRHIRTPGPHLACCKDRAGLGRVCCEGEEGGCGGGEEGECVGEVSRVGTSVCASAMQQIRAERG